MAGRYGRPPTGWGPDASRGEVIRIEVEFIRRLRSNDPEVGYKGWPLLG